MKRFLQLVGALACALVLAWWWLRGGGSGEVPREGGEPVVAEVPSPVEVAVEEPAQAPPEPVTGELPSWPVRAAAVRWTLRGSVFSPSWGGGLPDAKVRLAVHRPSEPREAEALTDGVGLFALEFDRLEWQPGDFARCWVHDADGALRFAGLVRLDSDLTITASDSVRLRGQVRCNWPMQDETLHVALFEPARRARRDARRIAAMGTDELGNFEVDGLLLEPTERVIAQVTLRGKDGTLALAGLEVALAELVSPAGAVLPLDVTRARIFVRDEHGKGIEGAQVRLAAAGQASFEIELGGTTDAEGGLDLTLASGVLECDVTAPGHEPSWSSFEALGAAATHEIRLRALEPDEALFGTVLHPDGRPAQAALVTVRPAGLDDSRSLPVGVVRTEADGTFRIAAPRGRELEVRVEHGRGSGGGPWAAQVDGNPLVLTLHALRTVEIAVSSDALPPQFSSGEIGYALVSEDDGRVVSGTAESSPFHVGGLAPGVWRVHLVAPGLGGCGEGSVVASELDPLGALQAAVIVPLREAHWVDAFVIDAERTPFAGTWAVAHGSWPPEVAAILGLGQCDSRGRLRAFCDARQARIELYAFPDEAPLEARVRTDEFAEIVLR